MASVTLKTSGFNSCHNMARLRFYPTIPHRAVSMRSDLISHLSKHAQEAVAALVQRLLAAYPSSIVRLLLFGSKARADDRSDSDIGVLVVTTKEHWAVKHALLTLGARLSLEHDVLFNFSVIEQEKWSWMGRVRHPLYRNVMVKGVDLMADRVKAAFPP